MEQLSNIGSEISRARRWQNKDADLFWGAVIRAQELFFLICRQKMERLAQKRDPPRL